MTVNRKDLAAGAIFAAVGLLYGGIAFTGLPLGNPLDMGPGYFPAVLSLSLFGLGVVIAARSFVVAQESPFGVVPWRGLIMLSLSTTVFATFIDELGMLPGIFVATFIAVMASPRVGLLRGALIALAIAIGCTLVFGYAVKVPVPIVGPAFGALSFRAV